MLSKGRGAERQLRCTRNWHISVAVLQRYFESKWRRKLSCETKGKHWRLNRNREGGWSKLWRKLLDHSNKPKAFRLEQAKARRETNNRRISRKSPSSKRAARQRPRRASVDNSEGTRVDEHKLPVTTAANAGGAASEKIRALGDSRGQQALRVRRRVQKGQWQHVPLLLRVLTKAWRK